MEGATTLTPFICFAGLLTKPVISTEGTNPNRVSRIHSWRRWILLLLLVLSQQHSFAMNTLSRYGLIDHGNACRTFTAIQCSTELDDVKTRNHSYSLDRLAEDCLSDGMLGSVSWGRARGNAIQSNSIQSISPSHHIRSISSPRQHISYSCLMWS